VLDLSSVLGDFLSFGLSSDSSVFGLLNDVLDLLWDQSVSVEVRDLGDVSWDILLMELELSVVGGSGDGLGVVFDLRLVGDLSLSSVGLDRSTVEVLSGLLFESGVVLEFAMLVLDSGSLVVGSLEGDGAGGGGQECGGEEFHCFK
jgi:hypothetical protein